MALSITLPPLLKIYDNLCRPVHAVNGTVPVLPASYVPPACVLSLPVTRGDCKPLYQTTDNTGNGRDKNTDFTRSSQIPADSYKPSPCLQRADHPQLSNLFILKYFFIG